MQCRRLRLCAKLPVRLRVSSACGLLSCLQEATEQCACRKGRRWARIPEGQSVVSERRVRKARWCSRNAKVQSDGAHIRRCRGTCAVLALVPGLRGRSMVNVWNQGSSYAVELQECWGPEEKVGAGRGCLRSALTRLPSRQQPEGESALEQSSAGQESRRGSLWSARCTGQLNSQCPALCLTAMMVCVGKASGNVLRVAAWARNDQLVPFKFE